uniref:YDG domain-containing protein n=1 Tax=Trichogramma kaykai TaxID=54128 RepID=A0ABD2XE86_9HYME
MWSSRKELNVGVHTELIDSISGHPKKWAHSIIYSGENELDEDQGQKIQFAVLGRELEGMKEALARNFTNGMNLDLASAPDVKVFKKLISKDISSIRYDGIFKVYAFWTEVNKNGLKTGRYLLINATISIRDSNAKNVNVEDPIKGIAIDSGWPSRAKLAEVHPPPQAGICGSAKSCASSIVLSGKYEGDIDMGDLISED